MTTTLAARRFFVVLLVGSALLLAAVVRPLAGALFTAIVLAAVLTPLQRRLSTKLGRRPRLAAGLLVAGLVVLVLGPLVALSTFVVTEATQGVRFVTATVRSDGVAGLIEQLPKSLRGVVTEGLSHLPADEGSGIDEKVGQQVTAQGTRAAGMLGGLVAATGSLLLDTVLMLIALFFLLVEGLAFIAWLDSVSPLRKGQTHELLAELKNVSYSIVVATLITAAIQALAALVGYLVARVPHPVFFTAVTFFVAFIPAVGAASVCQAAALLLLLTSHPHAALFLSLWGFLVVGLVDNLVKPILMRHGMEMPAAIVFFALLGGLAAFGAVGLLIGPLAVALFLTLLRMYRRDFVEPPA